MGTVECNGAGLRRFEAGLWRTVGTAAGEVDRRPTLKIFLGALKPVGLRRFGAIFLGPRAGLPKTEAGLRIIETGLREVHGPRCPARAGLCGTVAGLRGTLAGLCRTLAGLLQTATGLLYHK